MYNSNNNRFSAGTITGENWYTNRETIIKYHEIENEYKRKDKKVIKRRI